MSNQDVVQPVAQSEEEFAFLCTIADDLTNDDARLVYADWLEERGDSRGELLRKFVTAYQQRKRLPSLKPAPKSWSDVIGLTIISKIAKAELQDYRDEILPLARHAIELKARDANFDRPPKAPEVIGTTRLGGDPDLPAGSEYPHAANGDPLHFLGQFNLADLQGTIGGRMFPSAGMMSIFRTQAEDEKNCYPSDEDCKRLVQFASPDTQLARVERPPQEEEPHAPYRPDLQMVETLRLPGELDDWPGHSLEYEQISALDDVFPMNLGGTAYILLGHVTHGNIGEEPLADRPGWVQLVLVPHFEGPDYGISDMSLSYQLPAADLKAGRFDRLEATFG